MDFFIAFFLLLIGIILLGSILMPLGVLTLVIAGAIMERRAAKDRVLREMKKGMKEEE